MDTIYGANKREKISDVSILVGYFRDILPRSAYNGHTVYTPEVHGQIQEELGYVFDNALAQEAWDELQD